MVEPGYAAVGPAAMGETMGFLRKAHHLGLHAQPLQRREQLFSLLDWTTHVVLAVYHQGRSPSVADEFQRRLRQIVVVTRPKEGARSFVKLDVESIEGLAHHPRNSMHWSTHRWGLAPSLTLTATGKLKTLYDRIKGPGNNVDNIMIAHSLRPHTLDGHMALYKNVLHHSANKLPLWFMECLGMYVSKLNSCEYCFAPHIVFSAVYSLAAVASQLGVCWEDRQNSGWSLLPSIAHGY